MKRIVPPNVSATRASRLFFISVLLLVPALLFSSSFQQLLGFELGGQALRLWLPVALATIGLIVCGRPLFQLAAVELRQLKVGSSSIKALALIIALLTGLYHQFSQLLSAGGVQTDSWWVLAALISLMMLGLWIQLSAENPASLSLDQLLDSDPETVLQVRGKSEEAVAFEVLKVGDSVLVEPGQIVPIDGDLLTRSVKASNPLLGWTSHVLVKGAPIFAGSRLDSSVGSELPPAKIKVTALGEARYLSRVIQMVSAGQLSAPKTARMAERISGWLGYLTLAVAGTTALVWALEGQGLDSVIDRVLAVLISSSPFALSLAIPTVAAAISLTATRRGILIRDRLVFERARKAKVLVFNKTGTLTTGVRTVVKAELAVGNPLADVAELVSLAAGLEAGLNNSVALAISAEAKRLRVEPVPVRDQMVMPGQGVSARIEGYRFSIGGPSLLTQYGISIDVEDLMRVGAANSEGNTVVYVIRDSTLLGFLMLSDQVRTSSKRAVESLQDLGIRVVMMTGDDNGSANALARELGISEVYAEVLPHQQAQVVQSLQSGRKTVAMVGHGFDDSAALQQSDLGIAFGAGNELGLESVGVILTGSEPKDVVTAIRLSKLSSLKAGQNLAWAAGYNAAALALSSGVVPGLSVSPLLAAVLMSLSTLIVVANAQLIRRR